VVGRNIPFVQLPFNGSNKQYILTTLKYGILFALAECLKLTMLNCIREIYMRKLSVLAINCLIIFNLSITAYGFENLDEIIVRKSRQLAADDFAANAKDWLEDTGNHHIWQPETLAYKDVLTGVEVWRLSGSNNTRNRQQDISWPTISADGKYIALKMSRNTDAHESSWWDPQRYGLWFVSSLSGSNLRPLVNVPSRGINGYSYFCWSPSQKDVFYAPGADYLPGELDLAEENIYKITVSDTTELYSLYISGMPVLETKGVYGAKKGMSSDGTKMMFKGNPGGVQTFVPVTILPESSKGIDDADGFPITLAWDTYWGYLSAYTGTYHDQFLTGAGDDIWLHILPEDNTKAWMRMKLTGTAANGGPKIVQDRTPPYEWGGEFEYINTVRTNGEPEGASREGYRDPNCADNDDTTDCPNYFSHYTPDRWGSRIIYSNTGEGSVGIWNNQTKKHEIESFNTSYDAQHHDWHAWSDWSTSSSSPSDYSTQKILIQNYKDVNSQKVISSAHIAASGQYERLARPTQSPDGTKTVWHSTFLNTDLAAGIDTFYTVAYYPYPAEITSANSAGDIATIRFDWQNTKSDPNPRTYTTRGWPNETTDDRPIPRETSKYRLWRSKDKENWTQIKTIDANHFERFDFVNGGFKAGQNSYWEITDTPGNGTFYYGITSIEHSGLESRTLSNIFSITITGGNGSGIEASAYPDDPGGDSDFYDYLSAEELPKAPSTLTIDSTKKSSGYYRLSWTEPIDKALIRYYNIYYSTIIEPSPRQKYRIASVPVGTTTWLDWCADKTKDGKYKVTSVDTQGNETDVFRMRMKGKDCEPCE